MSDKSQLPKRSDFPPGAEFVIKEFDVPLVWIPSGGWFNWFGGTPQPYNASSLRVRPPFSFDLSAGTTYIIVPTRESGGPNGADQWPWRDYPRGWRRSSRTNHDVATGHGTGWSSGED